MYKKMFFITNHAIERFRQRIDNLPATTIIGIILNAMQDSCVIKRTYRSGQIYHCCVNGCDIFPIIHPPDPAKGGWPVITTIITADTKEGSELLRRAQKLCLKK